MQNLRHFKDVCVRLEFLWNRMMREMMGVIWWGHQKDCTVRGQVGVCQKGAESFMKLGYVKHQRASHKKDFSVPRGYVKLGLVGLEKQ